MSDVPTNWARNAFQKYIDLCGGGSAEARPFFSRLFQHAAELPDDDDRLQHLAMALQRRHDYMPGDSVNEVAGRLWRDPDRTEDLEVWTTQLLAAMVEDAVDESLRLMETDE